MSLRATAVKKGKKAMDKVGSGGIMCANAGSSMRDGHYSGSGRTRIGFEISSMFVSACYMNYFLICYVQSFS